MEKIERYSLMQGIRELFKSFIGNSMAEGNQNLEEMIKKLNLSEDSKKMLTENNPTIKRLEEKLNLGERFSNKKLPVEKITISDDSSMQPTEKVDSKEPTQGNEERVD